MEEDNNNLTNMLLYSIGNSIGTSNRRKKVTLEDKMNVLTAEMESYMTRFDNEIEQIEIKVYDLECMLDELEDYLVNREYGLSRSIFRRDRRKELEQMSNEKILEEIRKIEEDILQHKKEKDTYLEEYEKMSFTKIKIIVSAISILIRAMIWPILAIIVFLMWFVF